MPDLNAQTAGQELIRLGLIKENQLQEAWEQMGGRENDADRLMNWLGRQSR